VVRIGIFLLVYSIEAFYLYLHIFMPKEVNGHKFLNSSEVAKLAGVHRLTLLRWIREGKMPDVSRDRNGWRIFSETETAQVVAYAMSVGERTSPAQALLFPHLSGSAPLHYTRDQAPK